MAYDFTALQRAMAGRQHAQELPPDSLGSIAWLLREGWPIPPHLADPLATALLRIASGRLRDARSIFLVMRRGGRYDTALDRSWREPRDALIASAVASAPGTSLTAQAQHVLDAVNAPHPLPGTTREERELRETFGGRPEMQLSPEHVARIARGRSGRAPSDKLAKRHR